TRHPSTAPSARRGFPDSETLAPGGCGTLGPGGLGGRGSRSPTGTTRASRSARATRVVTGSIASRAQNATAFLSRPTTPSRLPRRGAPATAPPAVTVTVANTGTGTGTGIGAVAVTVPAPARPFGAQAAPDRLRVESLVARLVQQPGEEVVGVRAERHGEGLPRLELVAGGPRDPAGQGERSRGVLAVRAAAAAGEGSPQAEGGGRVVALHPLGRAVAGRAVLQSEDQGRGLVVTDQVVVAQVGRQGAGDGRGRGE